MGRFFDFITGGNPKVAANQLADLHYAVDGNYELVFLVVMQNICRRKYNNDGFMSLYLDNAIHNYSELGAVQLNALAAPRGIPIYDTISDFRQRLAKHLLARHIPPALVTGDNRYLTADFSTRLRNKDN